MAQTMPGNMSVSQLRRAALRGLLWLSGDHVARRVTDVLFTVVLARLLFPRDFGLLAMAAVVTTFVRVFARVGLGSAIIQRRDVDEEYLSTAFWANLVIGAFLAIVSAILGQVAGRALGEPQVGLIVLVLAPRFLITPWSNVQEAMLSRRMNFRAQALVSTQTSIVAGVLAIGMAYAGMGVWSLVAQTLAEYFVATILLFRTTRWLPKALFSWRKFQDAWSFGAPLLFSRLLAYFIRNLDNLLIARFIGSSALGLYTLGYTIFLVPIQDIGVIINRVIFSALSRLQDDSERLKRGFILATRYVTLIALPMMVGLALIASPFVEIVFGAKWLPAAPVISILAIAGFFQLMTTLGPSGLQAAGRPELQLRWYIMSVFIYIPAFVIGLRWGIVGVAAGYLVATCAMTPVQFSFVARVTGVTAREMWQALRPSVLGCMVMAASVSAASWAIGAALPKIVVLIVLVALGGMTYLATVWAIHRQTLSELIVLARQALPRGGHVEAGEA